MSERTHYINGEWHSGNGEEFVSYDPATQEIIWRGKIADTEQVNAAVTAARAAFSSWSHLEFEQRLNYLIAYRQVIEKNREEVARTISQEVGKPLWESRTEVQTMIGKLAISQQAYVERTGIREQQLVNGLSRTVHRANGVLAVFGPFNFPAHLPNGHIIPALLAGNTVILKPSELTPKVAELTVSLWQAAGLPAGVLNLVQGAKQTGQALLACEIDGVLFTGSYQTGRIIHQQFAGFPEKLLALELGGNNPLVVWDVTDYQAAAYTIIQSAFLTSGQRCTCARRLIIQQGTVGDALLEHLIAMTKRLHIAPYTTSPEPFMGPLVSAHAAQQLLTKQDVLLKQGGKALLESQRLSYSTAFVTPGIIDVTAVSALQDEELFGPQLIVSRCSDFEMAIKQANHTRYGLSAGLLSDRKELFQQFSLQSHAGLINWNCPLTGASGNAPFGGVGRSGNYRPAGYYAADYCAHPVANMVKEKLELPSQLPPGLSLNG